MVLSVVAILIGCDLDTEAGQRYFMKYLWERCLNFAADATSMAVSLMTSCILNNHLIGAPRRVAEWC